MLAAIKQTTDKMQYPKAVLNTNFPRPEMNFPEDQSGRREVLKTGDLTEIKTFREAFALARKLGLKEFIWHDPKRPGETMKYGTRLASETPAKPVATKPQSKKEVPAAPAKSPEKKSIISQSEYYSQLNTPKTNSMVLNQVLKTPIFKDPMAVAKHVNNTALKEELSPEDIAREKAIAEGEYKYAIDNDLQAYKNAYKAEVYKRANLKAPKIARPKGGLERNRYAQ